jgi:hypothetical protein
MVWFSQLLRKVLGERTAKLIEHALFLAGIGFLLVIIPTRLLAADHRVVVMCWVLLVMSGIFFSAAIYRSGFWDTHPTNGRRWRQHLSGAIVFVILIVGWYFLPAPKSEELTGSRGDEVSRIEDLLADVPDSTYRELVASVIHAFDPHADISIGNLLDTADGARTVDIEVRSSGENGLPLLVAVDIINLPAGRKAGIAFVDAADSKRADIKADAVVLCSNTGFELDAISKAKRKNIGLISILRQGDKRIKAIIEEQIYLRKVDITPVQITWNGDNLQNLNPNPDVLEYNGGSVAAWLQLKASLIAAMNPEVMFGIEKTFNFKAPTEFHKKGKPVLLRSMAVGFTPRVQWLSETVQLDAATAIYDYLRGRVRFPGGKNSYTIGPIDWEHGTTLSSPPPLDRLGIGLKPGEIELAFANVYGAPTKETKIAELDDLIRPEDLNLKISHEDLEKLKHSSQ